MEHRESDLYPSLARIVFLAAGLCLALWFVYVIRPVLLLFAFVLILFVVLNAPVAWLEQKGMPRSLAAFLICLGLAAFWALLGWLVIPRIVAQAATLITQLPDFIHLLSRRSSRLLAHYPSVQAWIDASSDAVPSVSALVMHLGAYTLSLFDLFTTALIVISSVIYMLISPRPLVKGCLSALPPPLRARAERAFVRGSNMVVGWMWSHLVIGSMEAVSVGIFLSLMGVPGALVWAGFTFFAELVPRIGPYLMAVPPLLAALAVHPIVALWVCLFYIVLNETMGNLVLPLVWGENMHLHPVSLIFAIAALWAAFGPPGALISVPISGFLKAFYEEFYLARYPLDTQLDAGVERILVREVAAKNAA